MKERRRVVLKVGDATRRVIWHAAKIISLINTRIGVDTLSISAKYSES